MGAFWCHRAPTSVTLRECCMWSLTVVRPFIRVSYTAIYRKPSNQSDRVVHNWPYTTDPGRRSHTPTRASRQPRTNQHVSRQQLGGRGMRASSRPRPWLVSPGRGQNWAPRKPRIKIGTRGTTRNCRFFPLTLKYAPECFEVLLCRSFIQFVAIRPASCIRIPSIRSAPIQSSWEVRAKGKLRPPNIM